MLPVDRRKSFFVITWSLLLCCCLAENHSASANGTETRTTRSAQFPTVVVGKDGNSLYYVNVTFGTPAQRQGLRVDIAQPYLWVLSDNQLSTCNSSVVGCNSSTKYEYNDSETATSLSDGHIYDFHFLDSIRINGTAVMDNLNFTNLDMGEDHIDEESSGNSPNNVSFYSTHLSIANASFFDAFFASYLTKGSLGLSAKISNTTSELNSDNFDNRFFFLDILTDMGIIECSSYSLWLGADTAPSSSSQVLESAYANSGKLIFGAVDPSLYYGPLTKLDMIPSYDPYTDGLTSSYPILPMGPIYIVSNTGKSLNMTAEEFLQPVLLDSRYTVNYLPLDTIVQVALQVGAIFVESLGNWLVPCTVANLGVHLDFTFAGTTITVPLGDFLSSTYDPISDTNIHFQNGDTACVLTMASRSRLGFNVLGGPFLKNIYLAVDLEGRSLAIAQARKVATRNYQSPSGSSTYLSPFINATSEIKAISSGYIPYATPGRLRSNITFYRDQFTAATTDIPDQFSAAIFSNALVSTGRSFYDTSRQRTSDTTSATPIESFVFSNSTSAAANRIFAPIKSPFALKDEKSTKVYVFSLLSILGVLSTVFLL